MADLLSKSARYVYVRLAIPRPHFETFVDEFGNEARALRTVREVCLRVIANLAEPTSDEDDASGSISDPGVPF